MVLRIAVYRVNFFEHLLLKSSESEMPPIRIKDKYSEHFSLGTDDDGTTTVDCQLPLLCLETFLSWQHVIHEISF